MAKNVVSVLLLAWLPLLYPAGSVARYAGQTNLETSSLEPYILIGESGKNVERTASDIIGQLFMRNYEILGKYTPAGDPNRCVIVVTNHDLLKAVAELKPTATFAAVVRIAVTREGEMTYVSCQNPVYWANAYLQENYTSVAEQIAKFKQDLVRAMPPLRGRFNRPFGGPRNHPLTPEKIRTYRFRRRAEAFNDQITLATFDSFEEAVAIIENRLASSALLTRVFEKTTPGKQVKLYGLALGGDTGEKRIFSLLDTERMKRTASMPYEILVVEKRVVMLPVRFRLPLSFPHIDRKTYRQLKAVDKNITQLLSTLVE
ncbi:MAG: hypothetical protein ACETWG_12990 [Candidatus Neomarinimicrobiota bacterium]